VGICLLTFDLSGTQGIGSTNWFKERERRRGLLF